MFEHLGLSFAEGFVSYVDWGQFETIVVQHFALKCGHSREVSTKFVGKKGHLSIVSSLEMKHSVNPLQNLQITFTLTTHKHLQNNGKCDL